MSTLPDLPLPSSSHRDGVKMPLNCVTSLLATHLAYGFSLHSEQKGGSFRFWPLSLASRALHSPSRAPPITQAAVSPTSCSNHVTSLLSL